MQLEDVTLMAHWQEQNQCVIVSNKDNIILVYYWTHNTKVKIKKSSEYVQKMLQLEIIIRSACNI